MANEKHGSKNELSVLLPGVSVKAAGEEILVQPFRFGKLPKAIALTASMASLILEALESVKSSEASIQIVDGKLEITNDTVIAFANLLAEGGETILDMIAFAIDKDREWLDQLESDEGIELTIAVVAVNFDFFKKRLSPMLERMISQLGGNLPKVGKKLPAGPKS